MGGCVAAEFETRLAHNYAGLSDTLRRAGDFVAQNPLDTATRSLRAIAAEARIAPASFSRLARALGYESFDSLRDSLRAKLGRQVNSFADRAGEIEAGGDFAHRHLSACSVNLETLTRELDYNALQHAAASLVAARRVYLFGALGATGIVEYLSYLAHFCADNWVLVGRQGGSLGGGLAGIGPQDVFIVVTKPPFSARAMRAAELARDQGAEVIVITDDRACPVLPTARHSFIVPTQSPHFYSSYVATLALIEILIGMVVGENGPKAQARIGHIEQSNRRLGETWDG